MSILITRDRRQPSSAMVSSQQQKTAAIHENNVSLRQSVDGASVPEWSPFWMEKTVPWIFSSAFVTLAVVLGVLGWYSTKQNGLCQTTPDKHYIWTYIPVLIFTILATAWGKVEYRFKQHQPWKSMASGPSTASQSVSLHYISPFTAFALLPALRSGHNGVATAISASLILKLAIVLSSGLFLLKMSKSSPAASSSRPQINLWLILLHLASIFDLLGSQL